MPSGSWFHILVSLQGWVTGSCSCGHRLRSAVAARMLWCKVASRDQGPWDPDILHPPPVVR